MATRTAEEEEEGAKGEAFGEAKDHVGLLLTGRDCVGHEMGIEKQRALNTPGNKLYDLPEVEKVMIEISLPLPPKEKRQAIIKRLVLETTEGFVLSDTERRELLSQLGRDERGKSKGRVCWQYVHNAMCGHSRYNVGMQGVRIGGFWHPGTDERVYLMNKSRK